MAECESGKEERPNTREGAQAKEYEAVFIRVSDWVERLLRGAIYVGLALLAAAQLLLAVPAVRTWAVKVERLEGIPLERSGPGIGP
ncbi:hypothetical protein ACFFNY_28690 [Paenibacillus hodogayensis]|uniref:Bacterial sugar transferase domain-containing protein n=1 Tax=Paenibacillus hodogayensis TaxID=279208 RepID=A0ABV5W4S3_9BACL